MANYTCTKSFSGYSYGQKIDSYAFGRLSLSEQGNFRKEEDTSLLSDNSSSSSSSSFADNYLRGDITGSGLYGGLDGDPSTLL